MPRRTAELAAEPPGIWGRSVRSLRFTFSFLMAIACCIAMATIFWQVEQFLITDSRFLLPGPPEPGIASSFFKVHGAAHASRQQITRVFLADFGRSIYLCPIRERRRQLLAVDWVKDASVSRIWPNQLVIRIVERKPVAFIQLSRTAGSMSYSLVDQDGVLLSLHRGMKLQLPVLVGIPASDTEESRRQRVRRFVRLQSELGPLMDRISEIDVSDVDNIKVIQVIDGKALTLMLGNQQFGQRFRNFLDNYEGIRNRLPNTTILDLRLKDRITVMGGSAR